MISEKEGEVTRLGGVLVLTREPTLVRGGKLSAMKIVPASTGVRGSVLEGKGTIGESAQEVEGSETSGSSDEEF